MYHKGDCNSKIQIKSQKPAWWSSVAERKYISGHEFKSTICNKYNWVTEVFWSSLLQESMEEFSCTAQSWLFIQRVSKSQEAKLLWRNISILTKTAFRIQCLWRIVLFNLEWKSEYNLFLCNYIKKHLYWNATQKHKWK